MTIGYPAIERDRKPVRRTVIERSALSLLILFAIVVRAWKIDQPIVENYVGRQIPTATVARNLERGSGFGSPLLDTGPFPNWFLVEPPIFESAAIFVKHISNFSLEASGRIVSIFGLMLTAWGVWSLVRARGTAIEALSAAAAVAAFPITIRYGRAFQPDSLALGCAIAGVALFDSSQQIQVRSRLRILINVVAWLSLATGIALKFVTAIAPMAALAVVIDQPKKIKKLALASTLIPALVWYVHAARMLLGGAGSLASRQSAAIWLDAAAIPHALAKLDLYQLAGKYLFVRSFTPFGFALVVIAFAFIKIDRIWKIWGAVAAIELIVLANKAHHEYYWQALVPVFAAALGSAIDSIHKKMGSVATIASLSVLFGLGLYQARSTYRTPTEWASLAEAAAEVERIVPRHSLVVAPEALLYQADRRGCRLELDRRSARRAASEWMRTVRDLENPTVIDSAVDLVEFYRIQGAEYLADLGGCDRERSAWRDAMRAKYQVVVDRPCVFIARLITIQSDDRRTVAAGNDFGRKGIKK
jgi:4-amino-4-deoxy-L-arabinose transferase-like glycosyltransferase